MWTLSRIWDACMQQPGLWIDVFTISMIALCILLPVAGALTTGIAIKLGAKIMIKKTALVVSKKLAGNAIKSGVVATVACVLMQSGGGGQAVPGPDDLDPVPETAASMAPESIRLSWDPVRLDGEIWHVLIDGQPEIATDNEDDFYRQLMDRLRALHARGTKRMVVDTSYYPGIDITRRLHDMAWEIGLHLDADRSVPGADDVH